MWVFALAAVINSTTHATPLTGRDVIIPDGGRHTFSVSIHSRSPVAASLTLDLEAEEKKRTIRIRIDDGRWHSRAIEGAQPSFKLALPKLAPGFHRVVVDLPRESADCSLDETTTTLQASSRLSWTGEFWRSSWAGLPDAVAQAELASQIEVPARAELDAVAAFVSLDHMHRRWGRSVKLSQGKQGPGFTFALKLDPTHTDLSHRGVAARISWRGKHVEIVARDSAGLADGAYALANPAFRKACSGETCLAPASGPGQRETEDAATSATVLHLTDAGFPAGFRAKGYGNHGFRLLWRRPAAWELRGWPTLTLPLRWPKHFPASAKATVHVKLNGAPLPSFRIPTQAGDSVAIPALTRIPKRFWKQPEWLFEIEVSVHEPDGTIRCTRADPELWVQIDPEARLDVPREEIQRSGIALLEQAARSGTSVVLSQELQWSRAPSLAAILFPLAAQGPIHWESVNTSCDGVLVTIGANDTPYLESQNGLVYSTDLSRPLPVIRRSQATTIHVSRTASCTELRAALASQAGTPVPQYSQFATATAIAFADQWHAVGPSSPVVSKRDVALSQSQPLSQKETATRLKSEREQRLRLVNMAFVPSLGLLMLVLAFWWRRSKTAHQLQSPSSNEAI